MYVTWMKCSSPICRQMGLPPFILIRQEKFFSMHEPTLELYKRTPKAEYRRGFMRGLPGHVFHICF